MGADVFAACAGAAGTGGGNTAPFCARCEYERQGKENLTRRGGFAML